MFCCSGEGRDRRTERNCDFDATLSLVEPLDFSSAVMPLVDIVLVWSADS